MQTAKRSESIFGVLPGIPERRRAASGDIEPSDPPLFVVALTHLTHDSEPRGEMQACELREVREVPQLSAPATRRETSSSAASGSDSGAGSRSGSVRFRRVTKLHRRGDRDSEDGLHVSQPVLETPATNDGLPLIAELSSHLSPLPLRAEVVLSFLVAPGLHLASGLALAGEMLTRRLERA